MSQPAARAFAPLLREVGDSLTVPLPDRIEILRELRADLESLTERLVADGLHHEEARRRAVEALVPVSATLEALGRLHEPFYARVTRRVTPERLRRVERWALAGSTLFVVVTGTISLVRFDIVSRAAPYGWVILGLAGLLFAAVVAKGFELWVKRDHSAPQRGLKSILALSGFTLVAGANVVLLDIYRLAATLERVPDQAAALGMTWLMRDAALLSVAIILSLAGGLSWFVLSQWVARLETQHREVLGLATDTHSTIHTEV